MKNIFTKYILLAVFIAIIFNSCSKEFEALPGNQVTQEDLFKSESGYKVAANGLYATLQNASYYGGSFITVPELYTPYTLPGGYDDATLTNISLAADAANTDTKVEATNPRIRNIWVAIYNTLRATNIFLNKGKDGKPAEISTDAIWNNLKAQALGIRALVHLDLLRLFGEHWDVNSNYGIPVVDYIPTVDAKPKRNTVAETYAAILKDLDAAESILDAQVVGTVEPTNPIEIVGSGKNYIDRWVIKALKARTYLYMKNPENKARTYADQVITKFEKSYLTTDLSKYYSSRNGLSESIFELSFSNQNPSNLNLTTYKNPSAFINDLVAGIDIAKIDDIFGRTGDTTMSLDVDGNAVVTRSQRASLIGGDATDKTLKYASLPELKNNPAYIIRLSEMYLIRAEADGNNLTHLADLREARGGGTTPLVAKTTNDATGMFEEIVAELNFEGAHSMCARARLNIDNYRTNGKGIFPIPQAELLANSNMVQNPNY